MKIGYGQNSPVFGEKDKNFEQVRALLKGVKADLIVLPELFATGYTFTSKDEAKGLAEISQGETGQFLKDMSNKTGAVVVGGFAEKDGSKVYNSAMMVYKEKIIDVYRKIHLFNKEKFCFSPGNKHLSVHEIKGMKIGIMVCFDWLFPEVCRTLALKGAQIIAHPANLVMRYCQNAMETRCLENRFFAVTANRVGTENMGEGDVTFTGGSQITSFDGKILSSAPKDKTFIDVVEIDEKKANDKMITEYNDVLKDRRVEFYEIC